MKIQRIYVDTFNPKKPPRIGGLVTEGPPAIVLDNMDWLTFDVHVGFAAGQEKRLRITISKGELALLTDTGLSHDPTVRLAGDRLDHGAEYRCGMCEYRFNEPVNGSCPSCDSDEIERSHV